MSVVDVADLLQQARDARRAERPDVGRRLLHEAEMLCRARSDERRLVTVLKGLAQIERDAGHPALARLSYEEAIAISRRLGEPLLLAHTVRHLGDLFVELGDTAAAAPCFDEALALYRAHPERDDLDFANALRPAAILRQFLGDTDGARELWTEARELYARAGVTAGVAECAGHLASATPALVDDPPLDAGPGVR